MEKVDEECVNTVELLCKAHSSYAAYTKYAFAFTETVAIDALCLTRRLQRLRYGIHIVVHIFYNVLSQILTTR